MGRNACRQSRCRVGATVGKLVFMLVALTVAFSVPGAAKDKDEGSTQIYQHTYDEVFQASQETIERMGLFVTNKDKDKGMISGKGDFTVQAWTKKCTFDIYIETISTKPETRVTIKPKIALGYAHNLTTRFFGELQKVLSTYR